MSAARNGGKSLYSNMSKLLFSFFEQVGFRK